MKAYVGQTRASGLVSRLASRGLGECVSRGELPPRREPWFYDNGAYSDFKHGRSFNVGQYVRDLRRIRQWPIAKPDFIVLPDIVAGGKLSLAESLGWVDWTRDAGVPLYLAVQNGMVPAEIELALPAIAGLFVGGSLEWKLETAESWVDFAHSRNLRVHVGRVGTAERVRWAHRINVDSIDSSLPLWSEGNLETFLDALAFDTPRLF